ncbi:MAG: hypothetical protein ACRCT6_12685, partial [Notoacmeibacter sp.]
MYRLNTLLSAFLFTASIVSSQAAEVGVASFTFDAPNRDRLVQALVTYPAQSGGYWDSIGDNAVFKGVKVKRDA